MLCPVFFHPACSGKKKNGIGCCYRSEHPPILLVVTALVVTADPTVMLKKDLEIDLRNYL